MSILTTYLPYYRTNHRYVINLHVHTKSLMVMVERCRLAIVRSDSKHLVYEGPVMNGAGRARTCDGRPLAAQE